MYINKQYILRLIFLILTFSIVPQFHAQPPFKVKLEEVSSNGEYKVIFEAETAQEDFVEGTQIVSLHDNEDSTIWQKKIPKGEEILVPIVSNKGDIPFVLKNRINFYDEFGNLKGTYSLSDNEKVCSVYNCGTSFQTYSSDGYDYYTFVLQDTDMKNIIMIALSDSGILRWKKSLNQYRPSAIQTYQDRIIVDDFRVAGVDYINTCYILDKNGNVIAQYKVDVKSPDYPPILNEKQNELWLYDGMNTKSYSLEDGELTQIIENKRIKDLIYLDNPRKLSFALFLLTYRFPLMQFSDKDINRLKELSAFEGTKHHDTRKYSTDLLNKINYGQTIRPQNRK